MEWQYVLRTLPFSYYRTGAQPTPLEKNSRACTFVISMLISLAVTLLFINCVLRCQCVSKDNLGYLLLEIVPEEFIRFETMLPWFNSIAAVIF